MPEITIFRRTIALHSAAWFIGCLLLISCSSSQEVKHKKTFFISEYNQSVPAFEDKSASDAGMSISLSLIDAKEANLAGFIRSILYDGIGAEEYAGKLIEDLTNDYKEALAENSEWAMIWLWVYEEKQTLDVRDYYAVIFRDTYMFLGGAHGNNYARRLVININSRELLSLYDTILEAGFDRLKSALERELRLLSESLMEEALPPGTPLSQGIFFEDDFAIQDYYPAADGLHFYWNAYDLAAYVFGPIEITLGWNEIEELLSPKGIALSRAFKK